MPPARRRWRAERRGGSLGGVTDSLRPRVLLSTGTSNRTTGLLREDALTGRNYSQAVAAAGGLPTMVAVLDPALAPAFAAGHDALLLTGGADVDPALFGAAPHPDLGSVDERRDAFELALYSAFRALGKPVLGICRGHQVINVAEGGTLHQHVPALPEAWQHDQRDLRGAPLHSVRLVAGSRLAEAFGTTDVRTNSYHHQAIAEVGAGLRPVAHAGDGLVEAVEERHGSWVLGVQWHPEMAFREHPEHAAPFRLLLAAVAFAGTRA